MRIRWFVTDLPFLEGVSLINNRRYDAEDWLDRPIGEVPLWRGAWKQRPFWVMPAGLTGQHQCHPEFFSSGEPWPVTLPDTVYNPNWIPECCGLFQRPVSIPVNVGLSVGVRYYPPVPVAIPISVGLSVGVRYYPPVPVAIPISVGLSVGVRYTTTSGSWSRAECGDYVFTASYTGWHLLILHGAGGAGANASVAGGTDLSGGAGGGGAESNSVLWLVAGTDYPVGVGCGGHVPGAGGGDVTIKDAGVDIATAAGAGGATDQVGGLGGLGGASLGDQVWTGGDGADGGAVTFGGGAGSCACYSPTGMPPGDGTDGVGQVGGIAPLLDGGDGGDGGDVGAGGANGTGPGGGGGGAGAGASAPAGLGFDGSISIVWPAP